MSPKFKKGALQIRRLILSGFLALVVGCGGRDTVAPDECGEHLEVVATVPTEGASDVPINALITVTFSSALDSGSLSRGGMTIDGVSGEVCCLGNALTFRPSQLLAYSQTYTVRVDSCLRGRDGQQPAGLFSWQFRTRPDPHLPDFPNPPGRLISTRQDQRRSGGLQGP